MGVLAAVSSREVDGSLVHVLKFAREETSLYATDLMGSGYVLLDRVRKRDGWTAVDVWGHISG